MTRSKKLNPETVRWRHVKPSSGTYQEEKYSVWLGRLRAWFYTDSGFSSAFAAKCLGTSHRYMQTVLRAMKELEMVKQTGKAGKSVWRLVKND